MQFGLFYQLPCAPGQSVVTRYQETLAQIRYGDELGFDSAWLAEAHFNVILNWLHGDASYSLVQRLKEAADFFLHGSAARSAPRTPVSRLHQSSRPQIRE